MQQEVLMRDVTLDLTPFEEKISLHRYLKEALDFPFYYGANLDALHDELASERDPLRIAVHYPKEPRGKMVDYLPKLLRSLRMRRGRTIIWKSPIRKRRNARRAARRMRGGGRSSASPFFGLKLERRDARTPPHPLAC